MSVRSAIEAELPFLRAEAEALMTDTVTIRYANGATTRDPDTGSSTPEYAERLTTHCKVQARSLQALMSEAGGRTAATVRLELHVPLAVVGVVAGDIAEITAAGPLSDPALVGRKLRITAPVSKSFATARRFEVVEVVS